MTLEEAKTAAMAGKMVQPDYFGAGWVMVYVGGTNPDFYDQNPITGSLLLHRFGERDEQAAWKTVTEKTA